MALLGPLGLETAKVLRKHRQGPHVHPCHLIQKTRQTTPVSSFIIFLLVKTYQQSKQMIEID